MSLSSLRHFGITRTWSSSSTYQGKCPAFVFRFLADGFYEPAAFAHHNAFLAVPFDTDRGPDFETRTF